MLNVILFSEDPESPACKNILNGSIVTRTPSGMKLMNVYLIFYALLILFFHVDKSIILGPTKTNFASSLYGGLKRTDEGSNMSKPPQSNSSRHNHRQVS